MFFFLISQLLIWKSIFEEKKKREEKRREEKKRKERASEEKRGRWASWPSLEASSSCMHFVPISLLSLSISKTLLSLPPLSLSLSFLYFSTLHAHVFFPQYSSADPNFPSPESDPPSPIHLLLRRLFHTKFPIKHSQNFQNTRRRIAQEKCRAIVLQKSYKRNELVLLLCTIQ